MLEPCRIVAIDDDFRLHQLLRHYLRAPEFELFTFEDPYTALMGLHDIGPDLVLCDVLMPGLDGWSLFRAVRTSPRFSHVPFILLSAHPASEADLHDLTELDDFVRKPCSVRELTERVRARIGAAEGLVPEPVGVPHPPKALMGVVARGEIARVLKHCEESGLTGRLRLERGDELRWLEFVGGELVRGGCSPEIAGADPVELVLVAEAGSYWIEPRPVDAEGLRRGDARPTGRAQFNSLAALPVGRFAVVNSEGGSVQIQTEGVNAPNFTVTTVVARGGQGLRKVESAWPHPLKRESDWDLARAQIDDQHDRVVALVRNMGPEMGPRRTVWAFEGKGVEGQVLAWAISFVAEQIQAEVGRLTTVAMLRGTLRRLARHDGTLAYFRVENSGRVVIDEPSSAARTTITGRRLPPGAVAGVARWSACFLAEAAELSQAVRTLSVRHVTRMMRSELGALGFYAALEAASSSEAARESTRLRTSKAST